MKFICDEILNASTYTMAYTEKYFFDCSTYKECRNCLESEHIYISKGYRLTESDKVPDMNCVIVEFSREDNRLLSEYRIMTVQKKYLKRFLRVLEEEKELGKELGKE